MMKAVKSRGIFPSLWHGNKSIANQKKLARSLKELRNANREERVKAYDTSVDVKL